MTSAETTTNPQPLADDRRADFLRSLTQLVDFYTANPDIPPPYAVYVFTETDGFTLDALADTYGRPQFGERRQITIHPPTDLHTDILISLPAGPVTL